MTRRVLVVVRLVNAADRSAPLQARGVVRRAFTVRGKAGRPDIVAGSESSSVDVAEVAAMHGEDQWDVVQFGKPGHPEAGTFLASAVGRIGDPRLRLGSPATAEVRERSWVGGNVLGRRLWSGHANPPRDVRGLVAFLRRSRGLRGALAADWNTGPRIMRARVTRAYVGDPDGVLGLLAPRSWRPYLVGTGSIGSDHDYVDVGVWIKPTRSWWRRHGDPWNHQD